MSKTTAFSTLPSASRNLQKKKNLKTQLWVKRKEREREDYSLPWTEILLLNKNPAVKIRLLLNWIVSFRSGNYKSMEQSFCYYGKPSVWAGSLINFMCWTKHMLTLWSQLTARPPARDFRDWRQSHGHQQHLGLKRVRKVQTNSFKGKMTIGAIFFYENIVRADRFR